jgi:hypothetical protein
MKTRTFLAMLGLAAAVFAETPKAPLTQAEAVSAVAAVLPDVQSIRGFDFKTKVPVTVIDDAKAREYALARFRRMTPEAKIRSDETAFRLLGLVPADLDVLKTLLDVLEEQAGGYYDPTTKSFYLLDDMPKEATGLLAAHEMTHALEDQRYDLDARLVKRLDDDDASFALSAVIEGSATAVAAVYVAQGIATGKLDAADLGAMGETVKMDRLNALPPVMRRQLLGPYALGLTFLGRGDVARLQSGFPRRDVDAAWENMPRSSEQILHPEKYWDPKLKDEPKRVSIPSPASLLGTGWKRAGSGVLGELTLGSLVGAPTPDAGNLASGQAQWTNAAAAGWGGDRFEVWTKGDAAVVIVATVWDTAKDAEEFASALPRGRGEFAFSRTGSKVGIVAGPAFEARDALLAMLVKP